MSVLFDLIAIAGLAALVFGVALINVAAAWIVGGLALMLLGFGGSRNASKKP